MPHSFSYKLHLSQAWWTRMRDSWCVYISIISSLSGGHRRSEGQGVKKGKMGTKRVVMQHAQHCIDSNGRAPQGALHHVSLPERLQQGNFVVFLFFKHCRTHTYFHSFLLFFFLKFFSLKFTRSHWLPLASHTHTHTHTYTHTHTHRWRSPSGMCLTPQTSGPPRLSITPCITSRLSRSGSEEDDSYLSCCTTLWLCMLK